ncbi:MAG: chemotaxis protein CheA [Fimbriimonadaceae bacterium]|nr:chemotaxis protein CheA [Chthonomonadaceae bacterium]MCO5295297.1 chemotaxis protein CheA [Fimbriimonadaceae bacterium]
MMDSGNDTEQYHDLFLQEATEQLEILERETLGLESDADLTRVQALFRAAHTLKGSSRAMGFVKIADLTHEMENLLDRLRTGEVRCSPTVVQALLEANDLLSDLTEDVRTGVDSGVNPQHLLETIRSLHGEAASRPPSRRLMRAQVALEPSCVMKFVRAFMAINAASEVGEIVECVPDRAALEEEQFDSEFEIYVMTGVSAAELQKRLQTIPEVASCHVTESAAQPESPQAPLPAPVLEPSAPSSSPKRLDTGQTVRVDVARMDELMNLVGELVIDRTRVAQLASSLASRFPGDEAIDQVQETVAHIGRITAGLQESILKARMLPIETVFSRFPRMVRDLAQSLKKEVGLEMRGADTEIDRSVIEIIGDPILHILRNSLDHGIEPPDLRERVDKPRRGTIVLSARHIENQIVIDIEDDGGGIDIERVKAKAVERGIIDSPTAAAMTEQEAVNLVFASGLSTAADVSDVSGRGVGMDIVKANIQRLGGMIDVQTRPGRGTRFTFRLPLTLAIIRGLLVRVGSGAYVVPISNIVETLLVREREIQRLPDSEVLVVRGTITPLVRLRSWFRGRIADDAVEDSDKRYVVVAGVADQRVGLIVDGLGGEQEVVIKSLGSNCGDTRGISGATILGDGTVALIVDVNEVVTKEAA